MKKFLKGINLKRILNADKNTFNSLFFLYINEITKKTNLKKNYFLSLKKKKIKIFWIKKNNTLIGFFTLYLNKFTNSLLNNIYIRDFYIKKKHRGKNIGFLIVEEISIIYSKKRIFKIKIYILNKNLEIKNFWKKLGFKKQKTMYIKKINDSN